MPYVSSFIDQWVQRYRNRPLIIHVLFSSEHTYKKHSILNAKLKTLCNHILEMDSSIAYNVVHLLFTAKHLCLKHNYIESTYEQTQTQIVHEMNMYINITDTSENQHIKSHQCLRQDAHLNVL